MEESDYVKIIEMLSEVVQPEEECVTAGWGTKTVTGLLMTTILQKINATITDKEECKSVSKSLLTQSICLRLCISRGMMHVPTVQK